MEPPRTLNSDQQVNNVNLIKYATAEKLFTIPKTLQQMISTHHNGKATYSQLGQRDCFVLFWGVGGGGGASMLHIRINWQDTVTSYKVPAMVKQVGY